ncbi:MAG TPA: 2-hydroxychromene-2-carboxylate isomerase [Burkholderiaceae bacterium]|nr:2-hydroxychromene-2-carboxylate isomerase [Burkholderiaceae bacterium]
MNKTIEFWFDFGSPTTYLAHTQLPRIARETGAQLLYKPMLLGGVFKATGNASPVSVPAKGRWMNRDIARWAGRYGVPFAFNPHFPINTLTLMRGAIGLQLRQPASFGPYVDVVFDAMWVQQSNLGDLAALATVLARAGIDADAFTALVADGEVKAALVAQTEAAVARGVFGAPTCFVGDEMFFGQDRLDFVRAAAGAA